MTFAVIEQDLVVNIVDAPAGFDGVVIDGLDPVPGIGWSYADGVFTPPEAAAELPRRRLTKRQFMDRLSESELGAIYGQDDQVTMKVWLAYFNALTPDPDGTSIDLDNPKTREGLEKIAPIVRALVPTFTPDRIAELLA